MKKISIISSILLILPFLVSAQTNVRENAQMRMETQKAEVQAQVEVRKMEMEQNQEARVVQMEEKKTNLQTRRTELQTKIEERKLEIQNTREERKMTMTANREERKLALTEQVRTRINETAERITEQFDSILARFDNAGTTISEHITRIEDQGVDVSEAIDLYTTAEAFLEVTQDTLIQAQIDLDVALGEDEVSREDIHDIIEDVRNSIQDTRNAYTAVIDSLKN